MTCAESLHRHRRALKLNILLAEAYQASGQGKSALRITAGALRFAVGEGFIRTFVDEGPAILDLVREVRTSSDIASEFFERILGPEAQEADTTAVVDALAEPLTDRETPPSPTARPWLPYTDHQALPALQYAMVGLHLRAVIVRDVALSRTPPLYTKSFYPSRGKRRRYVPQQNRCVCSIRTY